MTAQLSIIEPTTNEVATLSSLATQLAVLKKTNAEFVFDYADKDGNAAARSHIHKLRQTKAAIEKAAKAEREEAIAHQRAVIAKEKELVAEVVEMIDVHDKPLREFEAKAQALKDAIAARIEGMKVTAEWIMGKTSAELTARHDELELVNVEDGFGELYGEAFAQRIVSIDYLKAAITAAKKSEADAAELEALRDAAEKRRRADEEAALRQAEKECAEREAAEEAARVEAEAQRQAEDDARIAREREEAAEAERLRAAAREQELIEQAERDRDAAAAAAQRALEQAEQRQKDAVEAERRRQADERAAQEAEEARKAADRAHRGKIHSEIVTGIVGVITAIHPYDAAQSEALAKAIVVGICGDVIPNLKIVY